MLLFFKVTQDLCVILTQIHIDFVCVSGAPILILFVSFRLTHISKLNWVAKSLTVVTNIYPTHSTLSSESKYKLKQ